jgi:hypothetical protein
MPINLSQVAAKEPTVVVDARAGAELVPKRDPNKRHRPHPGGYGR